MNSLLTFRVAGVLTLAAGLFLAPPGCGGEEPQPSKAVKAEAGGSQGR